MLTLIIMERICYKFVLLNKLMLVSLVHNSGKFRGSIALRAGRGKNTATVPLLPVRLIAGTRVSSDSRCHFYVFIENTLCLLFLYSFVELDGSSVLFTCEDSSYGLEM